MNGLLYKEFKQNRIGVFETIVASAFVLVIPILLWACGITKSMKATFEFLVNDGRVLQFLYILATYSFAGEMQGKTLMGDDTKKWALFTVSNPKGVKGYLYTKYVFIFGMCGLMFVSSILFDALFCTIGYQVTKQEIASMSSVLVVLFYVQLFLRAIELPFFIRFGIKMGNMIKIIIVILLMIVLTIFVLVNPFDLMPKIIGCIDSLRNDEVSDTVALMIAIFPFLALGAYYLSYRFSCKVYMKGVEQYDK